MLFTLESVMGKICHPIFIDPRSISSVLSLSPRWLAETVQCLITIKIWPSKNTSISWALSHSKERCLFKEVWVTWCASPKPHVSPLEGALPLRAQEVKKVRQLQSKLTKVLPEDSSKDHISPKPVGSSPVQEITMASWPRLLMTLSEGYLTSSTLLR